MFIKYRTISFIFSGLLILACLFSFFRFGLNQGIDFTGGSILELNFEQRPDNQKIREVLAEFNLVESVQPTGEKGVILRFGEVNEETHQKILEKLRGLSPVEELRFEAIGPVIGQELKDKTKIVVVLSLLAIVLYIAIAFRKVSFPVSSWQYGLFSFLMLSHDVLIPLALFSFFGWQITIPVIAALLTVIGYAINNVVVVYDRLRENLLKLHFSASEFEKIANNSIKQTVTRQLGTSLTTLFPLLFIFFFGGETLKYFAIALIFGLLAGLYSSLFLAIPLLIAWLKFRKKI